MIKWSIRSRSAHMTTLHTFFIIIQYKDTSVLLYFAVNVTLLYSMYPLAHCELPHNYCYRLYKIRILQELPLRGLHWYTGPTGTWLYLFVPDSYMRKTSDVAGMAFLAKKWQKIWPKNGLKWPKIA